MAQSGSFSHLRSCLGLASWVSPCWSLVLDHFRFCRSFRGNPQHVVVESNRRFGEPVVSLKIKKESLVQSRKIKDAVATPFQHFDFIVNSFNKPTAFTCNEVVGDLFHPIRQGPAEFLKTLYSAFSHSFLPHSQLLPGFFFR